MKAAILFLFASLLFCCAADQRITPGDGELSWTVHQEIFDGATQIGYQFNRLTFTSDPVTGDAVEMTLEVRVTSASDGVLFDTFTSVPLSGNIAITWRPVLEDPANWFTGPFVATTPASTFIWADHVGAKSASIELADPTLNEFSIWADWKKVGNSVSPRITFDSKPNQFNKFLSNGQHKP